MVWDSVAPFHASRIETWRNIGARTLATCRRADNDGLPARRPVRFEGFDHPKGLHRGGVRHAAVADGAFLRATWECPYAGAFRGHSRHVKEETVSRTFMDLLLVWFRCCWERGGVGTTGRAKDA